MWIFIKELITSGFAKYPVQTIFAIALSFALYVVSPDDIRREITVLLSGQEYVQQIDQEQLEWSKKFITTETVRLLKNGTYDEEGARHVLNLISINKDSIQNFETSQFYRAEQLLVVKYRRVLKEDIQ